MKRIGIFGGSFDPIHYGHLHLAEEARCMARLDQVLFIPNWVSPFKQEKISDGCQKQLTRERLEMVRIAIASNPGFAVSDMEIRRGEVSYTADTLRRCREMMSPDTRLYFITGTDAFLNIEKWYQSKELLCNYSFIVGSRPGYRQEDLDKVMKRVKKDYDADVQKIEIPQLDISSSWIRKKIRKGISVRYLIPDDLIDYIERKGLYQKKSKKKEQRLNYEGINQAIDKVIQKRLKPSRLSHTYGVKKEAEQLAARFGGDACKAGTCALFHDAFREMGNLAHGPLAAEYMKEEFGITDEDMLNAVRFHTTGRRGMSLLEKIVFVADAIEENRSYPGVEELRAAAKRNLDEACLMSLNRTIEYVKQRGEELDSLTQEAEEYFKEALRRY